MNAAVIPFVGRAEREAKANLHALIEHSRMHRFFSGENAIEWAAC